MTWRVDYTTEGFECPIEIADGTWSHDSRDYTGDTSAPPSTEPVYTMTCCLVLRCAHPNCCGYRGSLEHRLNCTRYRADIHS